MQESKTGLSKDYYDIKEVAQMLNMSIDFVRGLIIKPKKNNLPATFVGRKYIIQKKDLDEFLNRSKWCK